jgi:rod shape-determining protein MreD
MMAPRIAIILLLACALVGDAALGALAPASPRPALLLLAVVAGAALSGGVRVGIVTGFGVGLLLDRLSGPESLAGVHALTALAVGTAAGVANRRPEGRRPPAQPSLSVAVVAGGSAVASAALLSVALHRLVGSDVGDLAAGVVVQALAVGSFVAPAAQRTLQWIAVRPLAQPRHRA